MTATSDDRYEALLAGRTRRPRSRSAAHTQVELDLVGERAGALGRAGRRLEIALARWRKVETGGAPDERDDALREVVAATYALLVQRECAGFRIDNLAWIRRYYDIPSAALRRL